MTNQNQNGISPVAAAVAGAVVGAGVAVAGTMILEDKRNREKIKKVLNNAKNQAINYVEDMQKQVKDKKNEVKENFIEGKGKVSKVAKSVKKSLDHAVKDVKKAAN